MATTTKKPAAKKTATKPTTKKTTSTRKSVAPKDVLAALKKKYDVVEKESDLYVVQLNQKWGFVDKNGKELISPRYVGIDTSFTDGIMSVWGDKGVGFVNDKGKEIVKPIYGASTSFAEGLAGVKKDGKWGFIDKTGKVVISIKYNEVNPFKNSKAEVVLNGKKITIDKKGTPIGNSTIKTIVKSPSKSVTVKTTEISVTGNKKIDTLRKEFNKKFPYLRLGIFYSYARQQVAKGESIKPIDGSKTLASVRRADSGGDISISGNKKIKSLEKEFDTVFGLYCQVCYTEKDGERYYTSGSIDEKTLASFNAECEKNGFKKNEWK